ncbi:MAG: DNA-3-methyladenine glycosylase family protein, partial [Flavobacteriales bacterium]
HVFCDRFLRLIGPDEPTCQRILSIEIEELRTIGLSQSKCNYIHNVCAFFIEHRLDDSALHAMSNDELTETLIRIKGVGKWTVQMLLMFAMAREDVFAPDDLGIRQAMIQLYGMNETNATKTRQRMLAISEQWKPYRSYACLALWSWKDLTKKGTSL